MFYNGDKVQIISDNENYEKFVGKTLVITHVANNEAEHLGFDNSVGQPLYDLEVEETGEEVPFSLYQYELDYA
jgi:hypothetical protein